MPKPGFSMDDLLHPKTRKYQANFSDRRPYRRPDGGIGAMAAVKIQESLGLKTPPVDLGPVCRHLAVSVTEVDQIQGQPDAVGRHRGYGLIEIVRGLPDKIYRVTLAHELGHEVLKHSLRSVWDTHESLMDVGDPHEAEAWAFAGELLMPYEVLKKNSTKPREELEILFEVSASAIAVQLSRRGLL